MTIPDVQRALEVTAPVESGTQTPPAAQTSPRESNYRRALGQSLSKQAPRESHNSNPVEPAGAEVGQADPLSGDQPPQTAGQTIRPQPAGPETENEASPPEGQAGRPVQSDTQSTAVADAEAGQLPMVYFEDIALVGIEAAQEAVDAGRIPVDLQPALTTQPSAAMESRPPQEDRPRQEDRPPRSVAQLMPPESLFAVPGNEHAAVIVTSAREMTVATDARIVELSVTQDADALSELKVAQSSSAAVADAAAIVEGAQPKTPVAQHPTAVQHAPSESASGHAESQNSVGRFSGLPGVEIVDTSHSDSRESISQFGEQSFNEVQGEAVVADTVESTLHDNLERVVHTPVVADGVEPPRDSRSTPHIDSTKSVGTEGVTSTGLDDTPVVISSEPVSSARSVEAELGNRSVMPAHAQSPRGQDTASERHGFERGTSDSASRVFLGQSVPRKTAVDVADSGQSPEKSHLTPNAVEQTVPVPVANGSKATAAVPLPAFGDTVVTPPADAPAAPDNTIPGIAVGTPPLTSEISARGPVGNAAGDIQADNTLVADETRQPVGSTATGTSIAGAKATGEASTPQTTDGRHMDLVNRVADALRGMQSHGKQISVRLSPPELGTLQIEVSLRDGVMTARMETQTAAAQRAILDNLPQLKESLAQNGTLVDRIVVEHSEDRGKQDEAGSDRGSGSESHANDRGRDQTRQDDASLNEHDEIVERDDNDASRSLSSMDQLDIQV